ncbi:MAG: hypothetical protein GWO24_17110, partial [Akkermansiaceae bacterium]|nr:hypothetical protein [Akkermansiaceae bacterium]
NDKSGYEERFSHVLFLLYWMNSGIPVGIHPFYDYEAQQGNLRFDPAM